IAAGGGSDVLLGGLDNDTLAAGGGDDILLGDHGFVDYVVLDADPSDVDRVSTTDPTLGGSDQIDAGAGYDLVFGGTAGDVITGGSQNDLIFGDHGKVEGDVNAALLPPALAVKPFTFTAINTGSGDAGGDDRISGDAGDDIILGEQGNDTVYGGAGDDDLIGGHNVAGGQDGGDVIDGGGGNDVVAGDNATV